MFAVQPLAARNSPQRWDSFSPNNIEETVSKLKPTARPVPDVDADPGVAALLQKQRQLFAELEIGRSKLDNLADELAEVPDAIEAAARTMLGEAVPIPDTARRVKLLAEQDAAQTAVATLERAVELLAPQVAKARSTAANRIGVEFNRDVIQPLARELDLGIMAVIDVARTFNGAIEDAQSAKLPFAYSISHWREILKLLGEIEQRHRAASAA